MKKLSILLCLLAAVAIVGGLMFAPGPALAEGDPEARKARILANLKLQFPQLASAEVAVGDFSPTEFEGLEMGSLTVKGGPPQQFLISKDDKKLYIIAGAAIDVSLDKAQIDAKLAERDAAKRKEAEQRQQRLADASTGVPVRGNPKAPVTIVEFSDFQCPYCSRGANTIEQVLEKYPNDVKIVFKHFPLGFHDWAKPAAIAANCAGDQKGDAFWTLHDQFFANQKAVNKGNVMAKSKEFLAGSGIDMAKWSNCAETTDSAEYKAAAAAVDADMALGQSLGVTGTPGFFINGEFLNGAQPIAAFEPLIEQAKSGGS